MKKYYTWFFVLITVIAFIAIFFIQKIRYLAADPQKDKDCPPLIPSHVLSNNTLIMQKPSISLPWSQKGGSINDASCLDKTAVYGIVQVTNENDIKQAIQFAKDNKLKISVAAVRHSMGGQAFYKNALVLDMRKFNNINLNASDKTVTAQSGATWHDIQNIIHPKFAIKAMQSTDIFSVGGSISVNAHGMDHTVGSVANTIISMRVLLPNGNIVTVSPTQNTELFRHVVGGYGLFGIILDAKLQLTDNVMYDAKQQIINYKDFPKIFSDQIMPNDSYGLMYGHLSTAPSSYLKEMILYTYQKADDYKGPIPPLTEVSNVPLRRFVLNLSKYGPVAAEVKWFSEKYIEPKLVDCSVSRNQGMKEGESCLVSRNDPMHDSVKYLKNDHPDETDILHEYYIPRDLFIPYIDAMREVLQKDNANLLNASVRIIHKEDMSLNYAPEDMFAIVLYLNQKTDKIGNEHMAKLTQDLIDITLAHKGTFFLPYQLHYTDEQLQKAYPNSEQFFNAKRTYDPEQLLTNTWYETYGKKKTQ